MAQRVDRILRRSLLYRSQWIDLVGNRNLALVESMAACGLRQSPVTRKRHQLHDLGLVREVVLTNPARKLAVRIGHKSGLVILCIICIKFLEERGT